VVLGDSTREGGQFDRSVHKAPYVAGQLRGQNAENGFGSVKVHSTLDVASLDNIARAC
jgi:hypothetical protein